MAPSIRLDENPTKINLAEDFHSNSGLSKYNQHLLAARISAYDEFKLQSPEELVSALQYSGTREFQLEKTKKSSKLRSLLVKRRSALQPLANFITFKELSYLLENTHSPTTDLEHRTTPSAGATHPLEIYILNWGIKHLPPGIYHHNLFTNSLSQLDTDLPSIEELVTTPERWINASTMIIFSLVLPRITKKYGDRGYRFALLEAGHASQNLLLSCIERKISGTVLGNYYDNVLCRLIKADGIEHVIGSTVVIGKL
ncbi:MAG: SagB/ThcOx family dehydrogenase [Candidatus Heimdallarchaeota archaeon]|nr:SagB/ThcOx family dehydrogenase [Candidatus Heimdallarchaeota archaeon]